MTRSKVLTDLASIADRYSRGESVTAIAEEYGVTRQHIDKVVREHYPRAAGLRQIQITNRRIERQLAEEAERAARMEEIRTEWVNGTREFRGTRGPCAYTDQDYLDALTACADSLGLPEGSMPGMRAYTIYYGTADGIPHPQAVVRRWKGWNRAATALGLTPTEKKRAYTRKFRDEDIVEAIAEFVKENGIMRSGAKAYDAWRIEQEGTLPSLSLITVRGTWSHYRAAAQRMLDAEGWSHS